jgi:hypothetical protein
VGFAVALLGVVWLPHPWRFYLLIASINATSLAIKADLFIYNITAKLYYTSTVFTRIIVNTSVFKKSITDYKRF